MKKFLFKIYRHEVIAHLSKINVTVIDSKVEKVNFHTIKVNHNLYGESVMHEICIVDSIQINFENYFQNYTVKELESLILRIVDKKIKEYE